MPFDAAKAVAATFCYSIRYALTPVFGIDFLSLCIAPEDPRFGRMVIEQSIVQRCTEQATGFRLLAKASPVTGSPRSPILSNEFKKCTTKSLRPKLLKSVQSEDGYGTDSDRSESYVYSPQTPPSTQWVALNTPRSATAQHYLPSPTSRPISPYPKQAELTYPSEGSLSSDGSRAAKRFRSEDEEGGEENHPSSYPSRSPPASPVRRKKAMTFSREARAAYLLLRLHVEDSKGGESRQRARRASA